MKLERSRNAIRNATVGVVSKIVSIVCPFVVRTVFIKQLGVQYLGMNSLFSSILMVLNLTEMGFSSAIVFSMYKPIAQDDQLSINALLYFYKRVYRWIGTIILAVGLCLIPFLPKLIHGTYPSDINLVFVYLVYLVNTVLSYFLFAYLGSLISAHQREDVISRINIWINLVMYGLQIVVLLTVKQYYAYLLIMPLFTVVNNIRTAVIARKMFPEYHPEGRITQQQRKDIQEKVSGLVISKVCMVTRNSFDSIFISMFLGLTETAMYNNYYFIMNSIVSVMGVLINSILAGVGNSVSMESVEKNYQDMNRMNFVYLWVSGWFTACLFCLYQPFMKLWVGEELMFPLHIVILICLYFYALKIGDVRSAYVQAAGLWWHNRYRSIAEAVANLTLNYFLGKHFGVSGIIAATLISLLVINFGYGSHIIFRFYFKEQKVSEYFLFNLLYAFVTIVVCTITFFLCSAIHLEGFLGLFTKAAVCAVLPNVLYFLLYMKTPMFQKSMPWFLNKFGFGRKLVKNFFSAV